MIKNLLENEMYRKYQNIISFLSLFLFSTLLLGGFGCDALLPDKFEEEKYNSPAIDAQASSILSQDTTGNIISARRMLDIVDSITRERLLADSITEDQVIIAQYDALIDSLNNVPLIRDSLQFVQFLNRDLTQDTIGSVAYALLNVSAGQSKDFYLYTSLIYTQSNINEYISVRLIKRDASAVTFSEDMIMETISSSSQLVPVAGGTLLVPTIKARYRIHADEGVYLVRFTKSNVLAFGRFAKILILSI